MRFARIPTFLLMVMLAGAGITHAAPKAASKAASRTTAKAGPKPKPKAAPATKAKKPVSAAAKAVAVHIREQATGQMKSVYATRGFWPLWAEDGKIGPEADALLDMLKTADRDGLKPAAYEIPELRKAVAAARSGDAPAVAAAELALSRIFARYVSDVRRPVNIGMTYLDAELKPRRLRPRDVLRDAALATSFHDYITGMGWMSPQYGRLRVLMAGAERSGLSDRDMARLHINLDRARLLPGPWVRHIVVDAASARLFYYQAGKLQGSMRVVAGTAETPTPMLAGMVRYAILNPYWNVPTDLAQRKIAPKILAGASLSSMRFEALSDWTPAARKLNATEIDWDAVASGASEVRLRQLPGGTNAMGRMKFMFPNDLGIYLHDTPDKTLLAKPDRHFSNGCVRLEDAPRLGRWMFGKALTAVAKRPEQDVALADPVPVYLTYFTATPTERGVGFLKDVYGRDGKPGT